MGEKIVQKRTRTGDWDPLADYGSMVDCCQDSDG
jgi:hypothetical protein